MFYNGWFVEKIRDFAWKATKDGLSFNTCSPKLLKAMINEHEGIQSKPEIRNPYLYRDSGLGEPSKEKQLQAYRRASKANRNIKDERDYL